MLRLPPRLVSRRHGLFAPASLVLLASLLAAGGCGGGGGGGSSHVASLSIETTTLPQATVDQAYDVALQASGGVPPYQWVVASGSTLPSGLGLDLSGHLSGTPTAGGTFGFSLVVTDSATTPSQDEHAYSLTVSPFGVTVALLHGGDAWIGETYPVSASEPSGSTFAFVQNQSGGSLTDASPSTSTAKYVPGPDPGTDVIRGTSSKGLTADVTIAVFPDPVVNMTARFSSTDVWHVRFEGKFDTSHPYDSDFHAALVTIGLRSPASVGTVGTTADEIAATWVRARILSWMNRYYLDNADGSAASGGLAISFPFEEPAPPHFSPDDGTVATPAVNQFNVISVIGGGGDGVIGTAFLDDTSNSSQENDTTTASAGTLGVFVDEIAAFFNTGYSNDTLPAAPVGEADLPALRALLYGLPSPGGRYAEIQRIGENFARTVGAVGAHEAGHSLGLQHTQPPQTGSIMNASASIAPSATYAFISSDVQELQTALPGPGRGGSPLTVAAMRAKDTAEEHEGDTAVVCGACRTESR